MKKIIVALFIVMVLLLLTKTEDTGVLIPSDAIRFRIIANSNSFQDQSKKLEVKKDLSPVFTSMLSNARNKDEARKSINENFPLIKNTIENHKVDYKINYGLNYFPEKKFKGVSYPAGNYESLVVTLGDGLGENWWCVLFPPLCLLEGNEENYDDATYSFYIKEIVDKYF